MIILDLQTVRIDISSKIKDTRASQLLFSLSQLELGSELESLQIIDSYTVQADLPTSTIKKAANNLIDFKKEQLMLLENLNDFDFAIEIGFLPGVTDNLAKTVATILKDSLKQNVAINVYSSQVFLLKANLSEIDLKQIIDTLHNPLIQRARVKTSLQFNQTGMGIEIPNVVLTSKQEITMVDLNVDDAILAELGSKGILDEDGSRRGPLALGLDYMKAIQAYFIKEGRNATDIELESIAQTWSEHCKHTIFADPIDELKEGLYKGYIKAATNQIRKDKGDKDFCVSVFSDNSGAIAFDDDYLITHKMETHNSPSALDPFGGAITGIVGVNRDAIGCGMGSKPIANLYGYCFGIPSLNSDSCVTLDQNRLIDGSVNFTESSHRKPCSQSPEKKFSTHEGLYRDKELTQKMLSPKRIMEGVIDGVRVGGNCSGIPTVHGFSYFHPSFRAKPLVFVGTLGLMPRLVNGKDSCQKAARPGDLIVVLGGRVGLDGIHGATFSSVEMDSSSPATAVQIGDPITQKKFSDAIIKEARDRGLYSSITDNGAGGISCSVAEMAKECGGCRVELDKVPLKYPGMQAWQIWISESQERMTLAIPPENWDEFNTLMKSRDVEAVVIGEFTDSGRCQVHYQGQMAMDIELEFLHDGLPERQLITRKPSPEWLAMNTSLRGANVPKQFSLLELLSHPNHCSKEFISQQYDHEVQAVSVLKPLQGRGRVNGDTAVIKPRIDSRKAAIISYGLKPEETDTDPYLMAARSIDAAIASAVATGANPDYIAILDNFCWNSSDEPERLYQLKETARACYDYAVAFGAPFISGKDSMFNDFKGYDANGEKIKISALPTLLISALGIIDDYSKVVSMDLKISGDKIYFLETAAMESVDAAANLSLYRRFYSAVQTELISSAMSLAHKPLKLALAHKAIAGQLGIQVEAGFDQDTGILVSIDPLKSKRFETLFPKAQLLGEVNETKRIKINAEDLSLEEATSTYRAPFSNYLNDQKKELAGVNQWLLL
ncbi:MAG: AIR synthase-related protein [Cyanobacteria bacterium]|nr:AIR synthase-related protein [Cyanobacteriota bacterium]